MMVSEMFGGLFRRYVALGAYLPLTSTQKQALRQWESTIGKTNSVNDSELLAMAQSIVESGDVVLALQKTAAAEMDMLRQEFDVEVTGRP